MEIERLNDSFSICSLADLAEIVWDCKFLFIGKTDAEISLVCPTKDVPAKALKRTDGWKGFRIAGVLDFSLVGVLSKISQLLAENDISIFAFSTYNTDYILIKAEQYETALALLEKAGYRIR